MKVALITNKLEARHGYLNIINKEPEKDESFDSMTYAISDYLNFNDIVYDGEVDELYIPSLLEFVSQETIGDYIKKWINITSIGGTITICGIDLLELFNDLSLSKINETQLNVILYSNNRKGCFSAHQVKTELESFGLSIEKVCINDGKYTIVARRK